MAEFTNQKDARVCAIWDMIYATIFLFVNGIYFGGFIHAIATGNDNFHIMDPEDMDIFDTKPWLVWIHMGVPFLVGVIQMVLSILLLLGTEEGICAKKASIYCQIWRNVNILLLIGYCAFSFFQGQWLIALIMLVMRIILFLSTEKYMTEVKNYTIGNGRQASILRSSAGVGGYRTFTAVGISNTE